MAGNLTERWRRTASARLDESDRSQARIAFFAALMQGLGRCLRIGGLGVGIWLVIQDILTIGAVIAAGILMRFGYGSGPEGGKKVASADKRTSLLSAPQTAAFFKRCRKSIHC